MHDLTQTVLQIYHSIPSDAWAVLLGGPLVAYAARLLEHIFGLKSKKVVTVVAASLSFAGPALQFLTASQGNNVFAIFPHAGELLATATLWYNFILKDGKFDTFLKQVEQYQNSSSPVTASITPEVTPTSTPETTEFPG